MSNDLDLGWQNWSITVEEYLPGTRLVGTAKFRYAKSATIAKKIYDAIPRIPPERHAEAKGRLVLAKPNGVVVDVQYWT